jgi:putative ABC transport system permease protein
MIRLRTFFTRLRGMLGTTRSDDELNSELQAHLEALSEENVRRGMTPEEACYAARREFGGVEQTKEEYRDQRGLPFLENLAQDLRYGLRMLAKSRAFTIIAVLTLAVGIGATSAVFSVVDRILFRSLPYPHDEQLVSFGLIAPIELREFMMATDYVEWRAEQKPFESMTTFTPGGADCDLTEQNPVRLNCALVESTFLPTFGIQPILGRNFTREEDRPHASRVAQITYGLWRSRFAGDASLVGKSISIDGQPTLIVGVLPADFEMPTLGKADLLVPQALDEASVQGNGPQSILRAFARLKPGVTIAQAQAALQPLFEKSLPQYGPQFREGLRLSVRSLRDRQVADSKAASWILLGSVLAVLLVACTNVANLLLARAATRQRELAVRTALGASRGRLIRQSLTESLLLGLLGGAAGCFVAYGLLRWFISLAPDGIPRLQQASLDFRVVLFAFAVSLLSGLLFGIAPALRRPAPELLAGKGTRATPRSDFRQMLMAAQIAASMILLAGAGLLLHSLWNLEKVSLGMEAENVIIGKISLADYRYPDTQKQVAFFNELETRLQRIPSVTSLALSDTLPPSGGMQATIYSRIEISGRERLADGTGGMVGWRSVTARYFSALGIPILRGRAFREEERAPGENPIILSESLARRLFPTEDPLGKNVRPISEAPWRTVVGIAADVKNNGLAAPPDPEYYVPWKADQGGYFREGYVIIRTPMSSKIVGDWIRSETAVIDPGLPVEIQTLSKRVGKLAQRPKFNALLLSLFAAIGMLLAAIGIYGVVGYLVTQRTQEIGIRMALGATPRNVLNMILLHFLRWTLAGALLGLLGSWFATRVLESLLFEVRAHDPWLLASAVVVLLAVAFLAAWIPAHRAMRVDPMVALRYE